MKREEFLIDIQNQNNHRPLLWEALQLTDGAVIEFGSGHGSTPYLRTFCKHEGRPFLSFDHDLEWCKQTGATHVPDLDWGSVDAKGASLLFIDHAPGERRQLDIAKYANDVDIIVCHDTEPAADHGYQMRQHFSKFKYVVEVKTEGAWATMLSNTIDVTQCIGVVWKQYEVSAYDPND